MPYAHCFGATRYQFADLKTLLAKATPARSGDRLAGLAARTAEERVAAQYALAELPLPVRCPTMPCLGGEDGRTLFITTAREGRPAEELAQQPWAGQVLSGRVEVPGLPAALVRL